MKWNALKISQQFIFDGHAIGFQHFLLFVCGNNAALMMHATTKHSRSTVKDHFLGNFSAVSFRDWVNVKYERERGRGGTASMSLACFSSTLFRLFLRGSFYSLVLSHTAFSASNRVSQSSFIGIARSRHHLVPTNMLSQPKIHYCFLFCRCLFFLLVAFFFVLSSTASASSNIFLVFVLFSFIWTSCAA